MTDFETKRIERLAKRGFELIEVRSYPEALVVARQLKRARWPGALDLQAQALAGMGKLDEAIAALERGTEAAPSEWGLWELLGNYLSDAGKLQPAAAAYERP